MRKVALTILIIITIFPLFASPSSIKALSRGNAVLTSDDVNYAFTHNPAFLRSSEFSFNLPFSGQLFNFSGLIENDLVRNLAEISSMDEKRMVDGIISLLREFNGTQPLLMLDESLGFSIKGIGLNLALREGILTTGGSLDTSLAFNMEAELAFGFGFDYTWDDYSLKIGIMSRLLGRVYSSFVGAKTVVNTVLSDSYDDIGIYQDILLSTDIGAYASFPLGFSCAMVVRNITDTVIEGKVDGIEGFPSPLSIDAALGWKGKWSILSLELEIGINAFNRIRNGIDLMRSLNAGATLGITDFIDLNAGINGGYPSFGLAFDIFFLDLSIAYCWQDFGLIYGLSPHDTVAIEFGLSF